MKLMSEEKFNEIIEYIDEYYFINNNVPTMQEIADNVNLNKSNVCRNLQVMCDRGLVEMNGGWRNIKTLKMKKMLKGVNYLPIVGTVACGTPVLAEENIESYITVSSQFLGQGKFFILRASGDSMINAGIEDGDLVLVRQQESANEGEIVVALVEDSATLKRFYIDNKRKQVRLHPENDSMEDMYFDNVSIQGVAIKVLKDLE